MNIDDESRIDNVATRSKILALHEAELPVGRLYKQFHQYGEHKADMHLQQDDYAYPLEDELYA